MYLDIPVSKIMTTLRRPDLLSRLFSTFHEEIALLYHPSFLQRLYNVVNIKLEVAYTSADTLRLELATNLREVFTITEKAPTRAFFLLKAPTSAFSVIVRLAIYKESPV